MPDNKQALERLRRFRIILTVFLVLIVILLCCICWLVYEHMAPLHQDIDGYHEFHCKELDVKCKKLLCPEGTIWSDEEDECLVSTANICCLDDQFIFSCFPLINSRQDQCLRISYNGVLLSGYKQMCRDGYIWVPWRRKCYKRDSVLGT